MTRKGFLFIFAILLIFHAELHSLGKVDWAPYVDPYSDFDLFVTSVLEDVSDNAASSDAPVIEVALPADDMMDAAAGDLMADAVFGDSPQKLRLTEVGWRRSCRPMVCEELCAPVCEVAPACDAALPMTEVSDNLPSPDAGYVVGGSYGPTGSMGGGGGGGGTPGGTPGNPNNPGGPGDPGGPGHLVPEPGSVVVWSALLLICGIVHRGASRVRSRS